MPILIDDLKTLALVGGLKTSAIYIALIVMMGVALTYLVIFKRRSKLIGIGDGGDHLMARMVRVHGNFCENAPFALALLMMLPLLGGSSFLVHVIGGLFLLGRIAHAYGLSQSAGKSLGRVVGMVMTHATFLIGAIVLLKAAFAL